MRHPKNHLNLLKSNIKNIKHAASNLENGKLIIFPTETVYGLGGDAENINAITNIYLVKRRPINHPMIVHIAPEADITFWATDIPKQAYKLISAFWPGPLTLILKRSSNVLKILTGGQDSVGLRCSSHPITQILLRMFKHGHGGIVGPSANKFGYISPTTAQHARDEFHDYNHLIDCVLDGGKSKIGIESTILDLSRIKSHGIVLLRPGEINVNQISSVIDLIPNTLSNETTPRAPGTLKAHYAPTTPLIQVKTHKLKNLLIYLQTKKLKVGLIQRSANIPHIFTHKTLTLSIYSQEYAHEIYSALRIMDNQNLDVILLEALPQTIEWQGINDRVQRASFIYQNSLTDNSILSK